MSTLRPRPPTEGSRSTSDSLETSAPGVSDTGRPSTVLPPCLSPETALPISDSSEADPRRRSPIGALKTSYDVTHVLTPAYPDRSGMTGVKSPCPPLQQAWGRAADHYATHDDTIRTIHAYAEYGTTAPDHYSHNQDKTAPHFPSPKPRPSTPSQTARTSTPRRLQDQVWWVKGLDG
jgi:hypothetical protein